MKETNYVIPLYILFFELPTFHTNLHSQIFLLEAIYIRKEESWSWGLKNRIYTFFHSISHIFNVSFFPSVLVTHCVPDLKLDRLSGMYSIWHVKSLLLLPAIHGSKCLLYFLSICNEFQPRSQLVGVWFLFSFFVFFFFLSFWWCRKALEPILM